MRELDKLLHEIPLDELMGESRPEFEAKPITLEKSEKSAGTARVKTHKAGAITAVAAAMALVIGGGMYWGVTHNKLNPFSFLSKNGVSSPIENQNRTLIEQFIEHRGGDAALLGESLVVFEDPIAPENYLGDVDGIKPDFQVLGYSYSGTIANIYFCYEDYYNLYHKKQDDDRISIEAMLEEYDRQMDKAAEDNDLVRLKTLEEEYSHLVENYDGTQENNDVSIDVEDNTSVFIKNSKGDVLFKDFSIPAFERIGDYYVGSATIDMTQVTDNKVSFECTYAGVKRDTLEIPLDKYRMTVYNTISCEEEIYTEPDMYYKEAVSFTVKSISYDKGFVDVTVDMPKNYELYDANAVGIYNESGNYISTPTFVTAVYENGTAPIRLTRAITDPIPSENNKPFTYTMHFSALNAPLEPERIEYFIVGSKRIYVNVSEKNNEAYGIYYTEENEYRGYNEISTLSGTHYYFKADMDNVKYMLDVFKSSCETVDVSAYNTYLYQGGVIVIYGDDGKCESYSARVNFFNTLDEDGNITPAVKTLLIDGEYYKLTDEQLTDYEALCNSIENKTPKGEEK